MELNVLKRRALKMSVFFLLLSLLMLFMANPQSPEFIVIILTIVINGLFIGGIVLISSLHIRRSDNQ